MTEIISENPQACCAPKIDSQLSFGKNSIHISKILELPFGAVP